MSNDIVLDDSEKFVYHHHYLIHNLAPHSTYQLEIRARNVYGWSPVSKLHTFFTLSGLWKQKYQFVLYFCFSWNFYLKSFLVFMLTDRQTISFLAETWEILVNLFMHISESNMLSESNNNSGLTKGGNCFLNLLLIISLLI